ncbi:tetratricopeptide repeat-containing sulfotransferase family protein [Thalassotalea fusca]
MLDVNYQPYQQNSPLFDGLSTNSSSDVYASDIQRIETAITHQDFSTAQSLCQQILSQNKYHSKAVYYLAMIAAEFDRFEQAVSILEQGLSYAPQNVNLWRLMTKYMSQKCSYPHAIFAAQKLIELAPQEVGNWLLLINSFEQSAQYNEAINICNDALKLFSGHTLPEAQLTIVLAHLQRSVGERMACECNYQQCLTSALLVGDACWGLANLKNYHFSEQQLAFMLQTFNRGYDHQGDGKQGTGNHSQQSKLAFALGKAFEDREDTQQAMHYYSLANQLKNERLDREELRAQEQLLTSSYTQESCSITAPLSPSQPIPIFIVGLPRSGSTLLEQILASHDDVECTMELLIVPNLVRRLKLRAINQGVTFQQLIATLTSADLAKFAQSYLHETEMFRTNKRYFIDKLPANFKHIGLLHKLFPQAIILDIRRDAVACGFSNYKQDYPHGHEFSYQLQDFVDYYQFYLNLMNHWQAILPGRVYTLSYSNLIANTEPQIKNVLQHCGLPFQQQCLSFYENKNVVYTASSEQVRQPITKKRDDHWQGYKAYLTELTNAFSLNGSST